MDHFLLGDPAYHIGKRRRLYGRRPNANNPGPQILPGLAMILNFDAIPNPDSESCLHDDFEFETSCARRTGRLRQRPAHDWRRSAHSTRTNRNGVSSADWKSRSFVISKPCRWHSYIHVFETLIYAFDSSKRKYLGVQ